jgi:E3 ubiquitin-protein ligase HERC4
VVVVASSGELYGFGRNVFGELGLGDSTNRQTPTRVDRLSTVSVVAVTGGGYTIALSKDEKQGESRRWRQCW